MVETKKSAPAAPEKSAQTVLDVLYTILSSISGMLKGNKVLTALRLNNGAFLYCLCFSVVFVYTFALTSMYIVPLSIRMAFTTVTAVITAIMWYKILLLDVEDKWDLIRYVTPVALGSILAMLAAKYSLNSFLSLYYLLIVGSRKVDFRKIAWVNLALGGFGMALVTVLSQVGVLPDLVYQTTRGARHSLGIIYPTDYAAHVFFLLAMYFWLRRGKLRWFELIVYGVIAGLLYYFCSTNLDVACILMLMVLSVLLRLKGVQKWAGRHKDLLVYFLPASAVTVIVVIMLFNSELGLSAWIHDHILSLYMRLDICHHMFYVYFPKLFGQFVPDIGNGGSTVPVPDEKYSFIDISYVRILLKNGLVTLVSLLLMCTHFVRRRVNKGDLAAAAVFVVITINCAVAHHFLDFSYSVFLLTLFSDFSAFDSHTEPRRLAAGK